jgi:hypothetical protein
MSHSSSTRLEMKKRIKKDLNNRIIYKLLEKDNIVAKAISNNKILPLQIRSQVIFGPSICSIRNFCSFTGRSRSIYRKLGLSYLQFRKFADNGLIPG